MSSKRSSTGAEGGLPAADGSALQQEAKGDPNVSKQRSSTGEQREHRDGSGVMATDLEVCS